MDSLAVELYGPVVREGECWSRPVRLDHKGYSLIWVGHASYRAHRLSWEYANAAPIPDDMVIDHLCLNRRCVNPNHLQVVTAEENNRRARGWRDGRCANGHDLHAPRAVVLWGHRRKFQRCRQCWNDYQRTFRERRKAAAA